MATKKETRKKKILVSNGEGAVHIFANSNNTIVSLTDSQGNVLASGTAGELGNRGAKKTTPYAAQQAVDKALKDVANFGISKVAIYVKGAGVAREAAIRQVGAAGLQVTMIKDVSPIPHNGCRPPKKRRL
ncbi:MAG: 30S ribosomal protein S11 [Clostridiales bacterium]|nr:30S ribosomal protein S11 [Clostridiales bacterium]